MSELFRGFAPVSAKASIHDTIDAAIRRVRTVTGDNGTLTITVSPQSAEGITAPLGTILMTDVRVPVGNAWVSVWELGETE
jgi:hypothetical protein